VEGRAGEETQSDLSSQRKREASVKNQNMTGGGEGKAAEKGGASLVAKERRTMDG